IVHAVHSRPALGCLLAFRDALSQIGVRPAINLEWPNGFHLNGSPEPTRAPCQAHAHKASPVRWSPGSKMPMLNASRGEWSSTKVRPESPWGESPSPHYPFGLKQPSPRPSPDSTQFLSLQIAAT